MNLKDKKGAISIFVLVMLLFMSAFLLISYAYNVNKSKTAKEQFNIISDIYAYGSGDEGAYDKAYTDLRNKNKQTLTASIENNSALELRKTFEEKISNLKIYGNSIQNGTASQATPLEVQSVGDLITDTADVNYGKYEIPIRITGKNLLNFPNGLEWTGYYTIAENIYIEEGTYTIRYDTTLKGGDSLPAIFMQGQNGAISGWCDNGSTTLDLSGTYNILAYSNGKSSANSTGITSKIEKLMLAKGTSTEYEPYYEPQIFNIYLNEPLRKIGDLVDYIDFQAGTVLRNIGKIESYNGETISTEWISTTGSLTTGATVYYQLDTQTNNESVTVPELSTYEDYTNIEVLTEVAPSKIEAEYIGYTLE